MRVHRSWVGFKMRGDIVKLLLSEARKRPDIAALCERAALLTDEEIATTVVPLPWFRQALRKLRDQRALEEAQRVISENPEAIVRGHLPDPWGDMRRWVGVSRFLQVERDNSIEIVPGRLLWVPDTGGVWIGTVFSKIVDPAIEDGSVSIGRVTKSNFARADQERILSQNPQLNAGEATLTGVPGMPPGVRIFR